MHTPKEHVSDTCHNPTGLCVLCHNSSSLFLALPGHAHQSRAACGPASAQELPVDVPTQGCPGLHCTQPVGTELQSEKGTLVRIAAISSGHLLWELRRGLKRQVLVVLTSVRTLPIYVSSNHGTVHIFAAKDPKKE